MANAYPQGCCLAVLVRFGWSNLGLDDVGSLFNTKNKKGRKKVRGRKRETK
jgi:hypothetical protein